MNGRLFLQAGETFCDQRTYLVPATLGDEMTENKQRFQYLQEPGGTWMVWDTVLELPAHFSKLALIGLTHEKAQGFCKLLNELTDKDDGLQSLAS